MSKDSVLPKYFNMIEFGHFITATSEILIISCFLKAFLGLRYFKKKHEGRLFVKPEPIPFFWAVFMSPNENIFTGKANIIRTFTLIIDIMMKTLFFIHLFYMILTFGSYENLPNWN